MLILCLYVDDLIFTDDFGIEYFKEVMESKFEMTNLGIMKISLGIEVQRSQSFIFISQSKYVTTILKIFNIFMWKLNPSDRTITLTKLLIKHAKFTPKETELEHDTNLY